MKAVTYKKFVKDNEIPKDKQSDVIPKYAVLVEGNTLPHGMDTAKARTDGLGYETFTEFDGKGIVVMKCRKEHGKYFKWE